MENWATSDGALGASMELQLLEAYIKKRTSSARRLRGALGMVPQGPAMMMMKKKKQAGKMKIFLDRIHPHKGDIDLKDSSLEGVAFRVLDCGPEKVADKLSSIVDCVPLGPAELEHDGPDDVIQTIVELLRESGDKLNEEIKRNNSLAEFFSANSFNYALFERLTSRFLKMVELNEIPSTKIPEQAKIALTFEVTSRLTAVNSHPMSRVMGFGAKYLQQYFSSWVQQHGGWEKVFDSEDIE